MCRFECGCLVLQCITSCDLAIMTLSRFQTNEKTPNEASGSDFYDRRRTTECIFFLFTEKLFQRQEIE